MIDKTLNLKSTLSMPDKADDFFTAFQNAGIGLWSFEIETNKFIFNTTFANLLDIEGKEELTYVNFLNLVNNEDRIKVNSVFENVIKNNADNILELSFRTKSTTGLGLKLLRFSGTLFYNDSIPESISGFVLDESEKLSADKETQTKERKIELELTKLVQEQTEKLRAANEELQSTNEKIARTNEELEDANKNLYRSNEELSQYAYVASHDLQEPLRKIRVFSGILSNQKSLTEENKSLVEKIDTSSARMSLLIKDLLEFSKLIKSYKMMRPVDLNQTIADVLSDFELVISEKKAKIQVGQLPELEAVGLQMNQLFYNIISNALKFVSKEVTPYIEINAKKLSPEEAKRFMPKIKSSTVYYDISIKDNGIGFDVEYSEKIFEVFKRLHAKDIYPGSGIGLALCRRIVTNHDGFLYSESQNGIGTTFHIILPNHHLKS